MSSVHARRVRVFDAEDNVLFVQHLVMLETVQERGRRAFRVAGEEYGSAGHSLRRFLFQYADKIVERGFEPAGFRKQEPAATAPSIHHQHHQSANRQRHPAALYNLQQVRHQEGQVYEQKRRHERGGGEC